MEGGLITFGDVSLVYNSSSRFLVDSGTSVITISSDAYASLVAYMTKHYNAMFDQTRNIITVLCSASLPLFVLNLIDVSGEHRTYSIPQKYYLSTFSSGYCSVLIQPLDLPNV